MKCNANQMELLYAGISNKLCRWSYHYSIFIAMSDNIPIFVDYVFINEA